MKSKSRKIVFFGNERLATGVTTNAPVVESLIADGWDITCVVVNFAQAKGRNQRRLEVEQLAGKYQLPLAVPKKLSEIKGQLESCGAIAGVLCAYGKLVPQAIIDIFPAGIVNIHPSLLPLHRGPTPIESVILDGSDRTGVSLMKLARGMDSGPVYAQKAVSLTGQETKQELADKLSALGAKMLIEYLPGILSGKNKGQPQNESLATYDRLIIKAGGIIDWSKPAQKIEREIRAYAGWPASRTKLGGHELIIKKAKVSLQEGKPGEFTHSKDNLRVFCAEGALDILEVQPAGKKTMPIGAFLRGYRL